MAAGLEMSRVVDWRSRPITLDCTGMELLRRGAEDRLAFAEFGLAVAIPEEERL